MSAALPGGDCTHQRWLNLETRRYACQHCGVDWESMRSSLTLYCAAFMLKTFPHGPSARPVWAADMIYFHAEDIREARLQFFRSEGRIVRQVQIAPVVGFHALDEHGDVLCA